MAVDSFQYLIVLIGNVPDNNLKSKMGSLVSSVQDTSIKYAGICTRNTFGKFSHLLDEKIDFKITDDFMSEFCVTDFSTENFQR